MEIAMDAVELLPWNVAVTTALPEADETDATLKLAVVLPWRTAMVDGIVNPGLLLDKVSDKLPAGFEIVTTQVVADPAVSLEE